MKKFKIFHSKRFDKELSKFDKRFQERVDKIEDKLVENPHYGNSLGIPIFREARFENYRIYYLVYEDLGSVYMVAISGKKDQQKIINTIRLLMDIFRREIESFNEQKKSDKEEVT